MVALFLLLVAVVSAELSCTPVGVPQSYLTVGSADDLQDVYYITSLDMYVSQTDAASQVNYVALRHSSFVAYREPESLRATVRVIETGNTGNYSVYIGWLQQPFNPSLMTCSNNGVDSVPWNCGIDAVVTPLEVYRDGSSTEHTVYLPAQDLPEPTTNGYVWLIYWTDYGSAVRLQTTDIAACADVAPADPACADVVRDPTLQYFLLGAWNSFTTATTQFSVEDTPRSFLLTFPVSGTFSFVSMTFSVFGFGYAPGAYSLHTKIFPGNINVTECTEDCRTSDSLASTVLFTDADTPYLEELITVRIAENVTVDPLVVLMWVEGAGYVTVDLAYVTVCALAECTKDVRTGTALLGSDGVWQAVNGTLYLVPNTLFAIIPIQQVAGRHSAIINYTTSYYGSSSESILEVACNGTSLWTVLESSVPFAIAPEPFSAFILRAVQGTALVAVDIQGVALCQSNVTTPSEAPSTATTELAYATGSSVTPMHSITTLIVCTLLVSVVLAVQ